jgi:hypothetical protein
MEIARQIKELKTGQPELRRFGFWIGAVLILLGGWMAYQSVGWHVWVWGAGLLLAGLGGLVPACLKQVYVGWMGIGIVLGTVVGTLLLTLFYYFMVSPLGLVARLTGKDFLSLKWDRKADSYWKLREPGNKDREDYERQF